MPGGCLCARMLRQGIASNRLPCPFLVRVGNHAGGHVGAHAGYLSVVWVVRSGQREGRVDLSHSGPDGGAFLPVTMPQVRVGLLREAQASRAGSPWLALERPRPQ